jgi:hypothetical protein
VLFCHPNPEIADNPDWLKESSRRARHPFEMWVSDDDMHSWYKKISLQHLTPAREGAKSKSQGINLYHYQDGYVDEEERRIVIAGDLNRNELVVINIPFSDLD